MFMETLLALPGNSPRLTFSQLGQEDGEVGRRNGGNQNSKSSGLASWPVAVRKINNRLISDSLRRKKGN